MFVETIGYVKIEKQDIDKIHSWIEKNKLSFRGKEFDVITHVDPEAIKQVTGDLLTEEEANTLINDCDLIRFYI